MSQTLNAQPRATTVTHPGVAELASAILALRPLWRLAGFAVLTATLAVAHVAVRLQADRVERELGTIQVQARIADSWQQALALDLETRRSSVHLEAAAAQLGLVPPTAVVRLPAAGEAR